jgi:hypothetical protein
LNSSIGSMPCSGCSQGRRSGKPLGTGIAPSCRPATRADRTRRSSNCRPSQP